MRGQQIDAWPPTLPLSSAPSFRGGTFYKVSGHKPISSSGKNGLRSRPRATLTDSYPTAVRLCQHFCCNKIHTTLTIVTIFQHAARGNETITRRGHPCRPSAQLPFFPS